MAGNQREMERLERRERKERRHKLIIWIILAVIVIILMIMKICEININSVKDHFTDENGNFTLTDGVVDDNFPYNLDASTNVTLVNANNKLGILTPNSYTVLDSKDASADYFFEHGYSNPVLSCTGIYSLVYDQGARKYRLDTVSQSVYEREAENTILCADVSKNGTVALATTSKEKLCDIVVYSKSLEDKFKLSISSGYVVDIAINDNSREVSVAVVNSENADLKTTVYTYNIYSDGSNESSVALPSGTLVDIRYTGNNIWTVGDSYIGVIKNGKYKECYEAGSVETKCFAYNTSGDLVLAYSKYSNSGDYIISYIKSSGKVKNEFELTANVKCVSATPTLISVMTNDEIISYNIKNGEERERVQISGSVKAMCRLGSSVYIHNQSFIDKSEVGTDD